MWNREEFNKKKTGSTQEILMVDILISFIFRLVVAANGMSDLKATCRRYDAILFWECECGEWEKKYQAHSYKNQLAAVRIHSRRVYIKSE